MLRHWESGQWLFIVHDGDPNHNCESDAGVYIAFCPWSGDPLEPLPNELPPLLNERYSDSAMPSSDGTKYCCRLMDMRVTDEDILVIYDPQTYEYLVPIYDGPKEWGCLGLTGAVLVFCPWCGKKLPETARSNYDGSPVKHSINIYELLRRQQRSV